MSRPRFELAARRAPGTAGGSSSTRLYTRTGDDGTTGLVGGTRVAKSSPRIRTFGAFDELGAQLGVARATIPARAEFASLDAELERLQHEIFLALAELATPIDARTQRIEERHVRRLEKEMDALTEAVDPVRSFVLPQGRQGGAQLHLARTVARRAERELWELHRSEPVRDPLLRWANRLSDLLFALALDANRLADVIETPPDYSV